MGPSRHNNCVGPAHRPKHRAPMILVRRHASAILAAMASVVVGSSVQAQSGLPPELPQGARPAGISVYLQATVVGAETYVCGMTDAFAWAWFLQDSTATLSDADGNALGKFSSRIRTVAPRSWEDANWQDVRGGKIVVVRVAGGQLSAQGPRAWLRYDVQSREGAGDFAGARTIVRVSSAWFNRPTHPCDQSHAGLQMQMPYQGIDLFMK